MGKPIPVSPLNKPTFEKSSCSNHNIKQRQVPLLPQNLSELHLAPKYLLSNSKALFQYAIIANH